MQCDMRLNSERLEDAIGAMAQQGDGEGADRVPHNVLNGCRIPFFDCEVLRNKDLEFSDKTTTRSRERKRWTMKKRRSGRRRRRKPIELCHTIFEKRQKST